MWFLDCYYYGALLGESFPVNTYGPASSAAIAELRERVRHNFDRTEIVRETLGQNPLPPEFWPGVERPR